MTEEKAELDCFTGCLFYGGMLALALVADNLWVIGIILILLLLRSWGYL